MSCRVDDGTEFVRSLYLPLSEDGALLPMASIAEIVAYLGPTRLPAAATDPMPGWVVGSVPWRGLELPVCALERLIGWPYVEPGERGRIVVVHGTTQPAVLPFLGMVIQALPSPVLASSATVHWIPAKSSSQIAGGGGGSATFRAGWMRPSEMAGYRISTLLRRPLSVQSRVNLQRLSPCRPTSVGQIAPPRPPRFRSEALEAPGVSVRSYVVQNGRSPPR